MADEPESDPLEPLIAFARSDAWDDPQDLIDQVKGQIETLNACVVQSAKCVVNLRRRASSDERMLLLLVALFCVEGFHQRISIAATVALVRIIEQTNAIDRLDWKTKRQLALIFAQGLNRELFEGFAFSFLSSLGEASIAAMDALLAVARDRSRARCALTTIRNIARQSDRSKLPEASILPVVLDCLHEADAPMKCLVCEVIQEVCTRMTDEVETALNLLSSDDDDDVRQFAVNALAAIPQRE
jgi:hypothetical protein